MKTLAYAGIAWAFLLLSFNVSASHSPTRHSILHSDKADIISERFRFYNRQFPEIAFAHVKGGEEWREDLNAVLSLLGKNATNLDYKHPAHLVQDVMLVNIERLVIMLQNNLVSASLYGSDREGPLHGKPLCVITLNPESYVADSRSALGYMLDLPPEILARVDPARLLDTKDHLRFTVDHEAYHCLESHYLGGAPMTHEEFGGEYNLYRRESGADAYALAMHRRRNDKSDRYAENIMLVRALWMFSESPNRCTIDTMQEISVMPRTDLAQKSPRQVFDIANTVRDRTVNDYQAYVRQQAAAFRAVRVLGLSADVFGQNWLKIESVKTRPNDVAYRIKRNRYYLDRLFDDRPIKFLPTDPDTNR